MLRWNALYGDPSHANVDFRFSNGRVLSSRRLDTGAKFETRRAMNLARI
jgi:hypothetical protein